MVGNAILEAATFKIVIKLSPSRLCKVCRLVTLADLKLFMAHVCRVNVFRGGMQGGVDLLFIGTNLDKILQHLLSDERMQSTSFYKVDNKFSDTFFTYSNFQES